MTEAAFQAAYAEWKVIKTRACVQLVFEIPIEQADAAYQALGGMPIAAKEVWCGIARLEKSVSRPSPPTAVERPEPVVSSPSVPAEPVRANKSPAQIAGYLCTTIAYQKFLKERFGKVWRESMEEVSDLSEDYGADAAAETVRKLCNVQSRADIKPDNVEWRGLTLAYMLWQREAEVVPA